jgi:type IV pilus assembly protein PilV
MKKPDIKMIKDKQRGSFVLEALIAILLFAIGILAIVGLQSASIRNTAGAKYRTDASLLANQIIGQMWAADKTNATLVADFCGGPTTPIGNCAPAAASKYPAWALAVTQALPGVQYPAWANALVPAPTGSVTAGTVNVPTISIDANNVATITVYWQAPNDLAAHSYSTIANIND